MFSRRQFLVTVAAGLTGLVSWRYIQSRDVNAVVSVLRHRLNYLKLDPEGLSKFANEFVKQQNFSSRKLRLIDMAGPIYTGLSSYMGNNKAIYNFKHGEERIASLYLLSSDFFQNGADPNKTVRYVDYYNPTYNMRVCDTPFARPVNYSAG
jgi:hypothetical protein